MERQPLSRRQFATTAAALTAVGLAGCSDDDGDDENGDDETFETDDPGALTLFFETEDGEPVSTGFSVLIEHEEEDYSSTYAEGIEDGELADINLIHEGEYTITVESEDGEFDDVEETVTLEEDDDEEETLVLEGATPDSELEDEEEPGDEDGEEEADDEEGETDDENGEADDEDEADDENDE
ncbi:S-layer protein [Natronococcus sp. A-GB7]|uniref:S-layer protein n=1 Tax=Natronococcus sp. A-GB7 TaxID=3037649 RepID=UPI00241C94E0|nr:S-layer protein [Natronococcus sp. A-GB7]MDG5819106.1 S-layer protein [Natronococcus sp. A-GB7]